MIIFLNMDFNLTIIFLNPELRQGSIKFCEPFYACIYLYKSDTLDINTKCALKLISK